MYIIKLSGYSVVLDVINTFLIENIQNNKKNGLVFSELSETFRYN